MVTDGTQQILLSVLAPSGSLARNASAHSREQDVIMYFLVAFMTIRRICSRCQFM